MLSHSLELAEGFEKHGYEAILMPKRGANKFWKRTEYLGGNDLTRPFKLKKIIEDPRTVAVISGGYSQNINLGLAGMLSSRKRLSSVKLIGVSHTAMARMRRGQTYKLPYRLFSKMILERLDHMVAVSRLVKKDLMDALFIKEDKVKVIYVPVNRNKILEMSAEEVEPEIQKLFDENRVIINTSRFTDQKRIDLLIRIFSMVRGVEDRVKLLLIGSGEEEGKLKRLVNELRLDKDVVFLPYTSNPSKYIARSYLFALTSKHEGCPTVLAEASTLGIPPISFYDDYIGSAETIVHNKTGYLIPFGDLEGFAKAIIDLLRNPEKRNRFGEEAKKFALKFDSEKIVKEFLNLIES